MTTPRGEIIQDPKPLESERVERSLLGGLLQDPSQLSLLAGDLSASDFYAPHHARLYTLLCAMAQGGVAIDLVTVMASVMFPRPDDYGGAGYVAQLPEHCPSTSNLGSYADIVREHARVRRLRTLATELVNASYGTGNYAGMPSGEIADEWISRLTELAVTRGQKKHTASLHESWVEAENERLDREAGSLAPPVATRFPGLDKLIECRPGDLVVIGGVPSMGKSALAQAFAMEFVHAGGSVQYSSLEMPRRRLALRFAAYILGIPTDRLRTWDLSGEEEREVGIFVRRLEAGELRLQITDRPRVNIGQVAAEARALWARGGLRAVFIDHLHLMNHGRWENRNTAIGETTSGAKALALELNVPVYLLSQLNRTAARRPDPRASRAKMAPPWWEEVAQPQLSDLRDSGNIEADADTVLFPIHASKCGLEGPKMATLGAIIVAKQRDGALGVVPCEWDGPCAAYRPFEAPLFPGG